MAHTMVAVPEGHAVTIHPPGTPVGTMPGAMHVTPAGMPLGAGRISDPAQAGALQAMSAALPVPGEQPKAPSKTKEQPKRKKKESAKEAKKDASAGE
jgi:hypothetical protein